MSGYSSQNSTKLDSSSQILVISDLEADDYGAILTLIGNLKAIGNNNNLHIHLSGAKMPPPYKEKYEQHLNDFIKVIESYDYIKKFSNTFTRDKFPSITLSVSKLDGYKYDQTNNQTFTHVLVIGPALDLLLFKDKIHDATMHMYHGFNWKTSFEDIENRFDAKTEQRKANFEFLNEGNIEQAKQELQNFSGVGNVVLTDTSVEKFPMNYNDFNDKITPYYTDALKDVYKHFDIYQVVIFLWEIIRKNPNNDIKKDGMPKFEFLLKIVAGLGEDATPAIQRAYEHRSNYDNIESHLAQWNLFIKTKEFQDVLNMKIKQGGKLANVGWADTMAVYSLLTGSVPQHVKQLEEITLKGFKTLDKTYVEYDKETFINEIMKYYTNITNEQDVKMTSRNDSTLLIIDVQNDFTNKDIPVDGGDNVVSAINKLLRINDGKYADEYAGYWSHIYASKDYHPISKDSKKHISFKDIPEHCIEQTKGSQFDKNIVGALKAGIEYINQSPSDTVFFKGFLMDHDSFGAVNYHKDSINDTKLHAMFNKYGDILPKTCLEEGGLCLGAYKIPLKNGKFPDNIKPNDNIDFQPTTEYLIENATMVHSLGSALSKNSKNSKIYICGLALDFCVLDTAINVKTMFPDKEVYIIIDAAYALNKTTTSLNDKVVNAFVDKCKKYNIKLIRSIDKSIDGRTGGGDGYNSIATRTHYFTDIEGAGFHDPENKLDDIFTFDKVESDVKIINGLKKPEDKLVFVGDINDRHNNEIRLLKSMVEMKQNLPDRVHYIIGNRDINKIRFVDELKIVNKTTKQFYTLNDLLSTSKREFPLFHYAKHIVQNADIYGFLNFDYESRFKTWPEAFKEEVKQCFKENDNITPLRYSGKWIPRTRIDTLVTSGMGIRFTMDKMDTVWKRIYECKALGLYPKEVQDDGLNISEIDTVFVCLLYSVMGGAYTTGGVNIVQTGKHSYLANLYWKYVNLCKVIHVEDIGKKKVVTVHGGLTNQLVYPGKDNENPNFLDIVNKYNNDLINFTKELSSPDHHYVQLDNKFYKNLEFYIDITGPSPPYPSPIVSRWNENKSNMYVGGASFDMTNNQGTLIDYVIVGHSPVGNAPTVIPIENGTTFVNLDVSNSNDNKGKSVYSTWASLTIDSNDGFNVFGQCYHEGQLIQYHNTLSDYKEYSKGKTRAISGDAKSAFFKYTINNTPFYSYTLLPSFNIATIPREDVLEPLPIFTDLIMVVANGSGPMDKKTQMVTKYLDENAKSFDNNSRIMLGFDGDDKNAPPPQLIHELIEQLDERKLVVAGVIQVQVRHPQWGLPSHPNNYNFKRNLYTFAYHSDQSHPELNDDEKHIRELIYVDNGPFSENGNYTGNWGGFDENKKPMGATAAWMKLFESTFKDYTFTRHLAAFWDSSPYTNKEGKRVLRGNYDVSITKSTVDNAGALGVKMHVGVIESKDEKQQGGRKRQLFTAIYSFVGITLASTIIGSIK